MTRKDYVLLATAFAEALASADDRAKAGVWIAIRRVEVALVKDNPSFDVGMFANAIVQQHQVMVATKIWS